jgi:GNAT superfamily N-acetyltransferase
MTASPLAGPRAADGAATDAMGQLQLQIEWQPPAPEHREQVARAVSESGLFRPEEVQIALEVFDSYCQDPGADYWALAGYSDPDTLAGFALYGPTPGTVGTWDLYWIVVRKELQGHGVGKRLLARVEQHMRSAGARLCAIETSSRAEYAGTRHFYLNSGYGEVARVPAFYADGDDRVTYTKRLG